MCITAWRHCALLEVGTLSSNQAMHCSASGSLLSSAEEAAPPIHIHGAGGSRGVGRQLNLHGLGQMQLCRLELGDVNLQATRLR